jgi:hypothetical protein
MNRTAWLGAMLVAAALLQGQIRQPKAFPPDIGPATITVSGLGGRSIELTMADMGSFPQHTVKAADHGVPVTFDGVLLKDLLAKVDVPVGEAFHRTAAEYYVVVGAADGYRAVFAWAEVDSSFMDKPVYLVTQRDGKPLASSDGPFEVVAPGEKRNARWVKQVTELAIRQAN